MRTMIVTTLAAILTAAVGVAALQGAGVSPHVSALLPALGATVLASILGGLPLALVGQASPLARAQAALACTMIHLFVMILAGGVIILGKFTADLAFIYWLSGLYLSTLIAMVGSIISSLSAAAPDGKI
jgi:hypothetical protein